MIKLNKKGWNVITTSCPICAEPTRVYMGNARKDGLCGHHADLLKENKIKLLDGHYVYTSTGEIVTSEEKKEAASLKESNCIICGKPSGGKPLCYNEFQRAKEMSIDLIKSHNNADDLITYYRRLKNNMYHMYGEEIVKDNSVKLVAIALALDSGFECHMFLDVVYTDIRAIFEARKKRPTKLTEVAKKMDEAGGHVFRSEDHHELDNQSEADIDDILFHLQTDPILLRKKVSPYHIPHYDVSEINERGVNADWCVGFTYYPAAVFYIEYWGVKNDAGYEKNKQEKIELYKKHNIPVLGIEADEVRNRNTLTSRIKEFLMKRVEDSR